MIFCTNDDKRWGLIARCVWRAQCGALGFARDHWTALSPECHAEFRRINLHWHDLRHEYASGLVEKNVPLAQVRDLLGHASITTTERYDNQKLENSKPQQRASNAARSSIRAPLHDYTIGARLTTKHAEWDR